MGNSILQSGASVGAIVTPIIIIAMVGKNMAPDAWRPPFLIIGAVGIVWALIWFMTIRNNDQLKPEKEEQEKDLYRGQWLVRFLINPRFWALALTVLSINTSWQLIRAWLPKFLQQGRGYSETAALTFNSVYYVATDVGCLVAGAAVMSMAHRGWNVHRARLWVFTICALTCTLTTVISFLPQSWLLLATLLVIGAATLGLFPCYYSFSQELNAKHIGKASGVLSAIGWLVSAPMHKYFGRLADETGSFDTGIMLVGWAPMIGVIAMWLLWPSDHETPANEAIT
jgi:ACS family hexuronate transporter-like MFS transporter